MFQRRTAEGISRRYDRLAAIYAPVSALFLLAPGTRREAIDRLGLEPGASVLEVGCGTGANLAPIVAAVGEAGRVTGIDLSPGMLARAERLVGERGWRNVDLIEGDARSATLPEPIDAVLFSLSYSVMPEPRETLARVWERLASSGVVVVMDGGVPDGPLGRALRPLASMMSAATVLGDPDSRPWDDLAALGAEVETVRLQAGTYFVCRGTKAEVAVSRR
jgi:ubiquinone/menaquinone biosynthesis C-methylase UbiE